MSSTPIMAGGDDDLGFRPLAAQSSGDDDLGFRPLSASNPQAAAVAPAPKGFDEQHPYLAKAADVLQNRIVEPVTNVARSVNQSLSDIPKVFMAPPEPEEQETPFTGTYSANPDVRTASLLARRGARLASDLGNVIAAPFSTATAPVQKEFSRSIEPLIPQGSNPDVNAINRAVIPPIVLGPLAAETGAPEESTKLANRYGAEIAAQESEPAIRPIRGLLPALAREPIITPARPRSVIGSVERAGPIPADERLPMPTYATRPVRGLLTAGAPRIASPEDAFQSIAGPGQAPIQLGEGLRTAAGAIRTPGRVLGEQKLLPAGLSGPEESEFLAGNATPTPRIPPVATGGLVEDADLGFRPLHSLSDEEITRNNAQQMVREAADFLSQQERPGRYRADISTAPGEMRTAANAREQDQAWFGVKSLRDQFPWFSEMNETPKQLTDAVKRGKGPVYDRLVNAAADYYKQRQAEAAPYVEKYAPQAKQLADQVRSVDPEMAENLDQLARGHFPLYSSLYDFAQAAKEQLNNAQLAAEFSRAIDDAANAERGSTQREGASSFPRGGETIGGEETGHDPLDIFLGSEDPLSSRRGEAGAVSPELLRDVFSGRLPKEAYQKFAAEPAIRGIGLGEKYAKIRDIDPDVVEGLHLLDNAPAYFRAKAAQTIHNVIGGLSREQERLFTLMADADSRENLRTQHPQEYQQALRDPDIQDALRKYRPIEQELTQARQRMGGQTLDQDYLRRIYEQHVSGVGQETAPGSGERGTTAFDRVIRPQRIGGLSREATAEYHYQNGLHEFGPAFGTKFIGTHLAGLRDSVAHDFISKATEVQPGAAEPKYITYEGERYYRPDVAKEMRDAGRKNVEAYDRYDPTAGLKYQQAGASKFLGPREIVRAMNDYGSRPDEGVSPVRRFLQEQTIGFGFGIPHVANILRRVTQSAPLGAANPEAWARAWKVAFDKGLRDRGINGLDDPTFDRLAKQGSVNITGMDNLKAYWGGNLNPANWARTLAGVGHKLLFDPKSFKGFGGIDQRARLYIANLVKSQNPDISDSELARAVNDQLGDYNRANWNEQQKTLSKFMLFPGWDASSIRWVIQHPIKTTVPPALLVWTANQVLHNLGQNRDEDASDIQNIHWGDRSIGLGILRESMARNLERPAINFAQSKISSESNQRALGQAARGITQGAGGLVSTLRPDVTAGIDLAMNRQSPFGGQELVEPQDYNTPGRVLPNKALEKQAALVIRHAIPALDRMLDSDQGIDFRSFAGSNIGVPNYQDGADERLKRNAADSAEVSQTLSRLAKSNPAMARDYIQDPDNAASALFRREFERMDVTLNRIDSAREEVQSAKNLSAAEKRERLAQIDNARKNLLRNADGLDSFRDSSLARIFTDEFEMKLWNTLLSCDDPTIVQDTLALARAYGLRVSKKGSVR